MKWFGVDSDTPSDPTIRRVIRRFGNEGFGALVRLWCFVAAHGAEAGLAVKKGSGKPLALEDLADAMGMSDEACKTLLDYCAEVDHIDRDQWTEHSIVYIPAQAKRCDEYTRKKGRTKARSAEAPGVLPLDSGDSPDDVRTLSGEHHTIRDNKRSDHNTKNVSAHAHTFDAFWSAYPNKVGRLRALEAWAKIAPSPELAATIVAAVQTHTRSRNWTDEGGKWVPHPTTYLNGRRWEDKLQPASAAAASPQLERERARNGRTPVIPGKYDFTMTQQAEGTC